MRPPLNPRESEDTLFDGALSLRQPARGEGYRVNVDAVLLAWFAGTPRRSRRTVDLGSGVGAVGLTMLLRKTAQRAVLVEQDPTLAALARANVAGNGFSGTGEVVEADVADDEAMRGIRGDLVVCNPPYVEPGRGRPPRVATAARMGGLDAFVRRARACLAPRGRACFVYPAAELATIVETFRASGLEPKRLCLVHASAGSHARVALVEALPAKRGGLVVLPPVFERVGEGPSPVMNAMLTGA